MIASPRRSHAQTRLSTPDHGHPPQPAAGHPAQPLVCLYGPHRLEILCPGLCLVRNALRVILDVCRLCFYFYFPSPTLHRTRQYPLYSKTEPPKALQGHFEKGEFEKSQAYGKDKAKFAFVSGLYKQTLDSLMLQFGFYAWSWKASGCLLAKLGYGAEYQVLSASKFSTSISLTGYIDHAVDWLCVHLVLCVLSSDATIASLWNVCFGRKTRIQQNDT